MCEIEMSAADGVAQLSDAQLRRELAQRSSRWSPEQIARMARRELLDLVTESRS